MCWLWGKYTSKADRYERNSIIPKSSFYFICKPEWLVCVQNVYMCFVAQMCVAQLLFFADILKTI